MPWIILPNGKRVYTEKAIKPDEVDDFLSHEFDHPAQPSADVLLNEAKQTLSDTAPQPQQQTPIPQESAPTVNPELHRKDTQMFDVNTDSIDNWISNQASKLPDRFMGQSNIQARAGNALSTMANIPIDLIQSIFGAPEAPALMGMGAMRGSLNNIAEQARAPIPEQLALPPSPFDRPPASRYSGRTFAAGQSGGSGQVIDMMEAKQNPSLFTDVTGRGSQPPLAPAADIGAQQEADRIANLKYTAAEQHPGSALTLPDKQAPIPPVSGDTRGGFAAQTPQEMQYPYNVLPNLVRPRAAQSEILSQTAVRDLDLTKPVQTGSDIHFISGGPENPIWPVEDTQSAPSGYFGTGQPIINEKGIEIAPAQATNRPRPSGPWDRNIGAGPRANPADAVYNNAREKFNMGRDLPAAVLPPVKPVPKPLDIINSSPIKITDVSGIQRIPPGQADVPPIIMIDTSNPRGMSGFRAETTSPHIAMKNFPESRAVIEPILNSNDEKYKWLATIQREFADVSKGLELPEREQLMRVMNGEKVNASPDIMARAARAKSLTDSVYELAQSKTDDKIGFIDNYITHMQRQPRGFIENAKAIIEHHIGKESPLYKVFTGDEAATKPGTGIGDFYNKGMGDPSSPFIESRTGNIRELETDYNRIMPIYLESMAKVIHDKPAVEAALEGLKKIPDGTVLKEYLRGYVQNYSRYDSDPLLANKWNALANQIATRNAQSVISFNPIIHMYHAGQLPANVWPELGTKYSAHGLKEFLSSPHKNYQELARNGLFSGQIRPMSFQTPEQKFDSVGYFMNMVESIVKGTGYYGFKQKFLDEGMSEADAVMRAIQETKNVTATVDPARHMRYFTPESNMKGGQFSRLLKQYHQIPAKLVEQFSHAASNFKEDPAKLARYLIGTSIAAGGAAAGAHTLHINPTQQILDFAGGGGGQFGRVMTNIFRMLAKGDVIGATKQAAEWATPGGASIKKGMQFVAGEQK